MIVIDSVVRRFGRAVALDGVSAEIPTGQSVALWGANGAGKTTLLRCVLGLIRFRGSVTVDAHDVRRHGKAARMRIGHVPQEIGFHDDQRVAESIRFFAALKGLRIRSTDEVLARVGLEGHGGKRVRELSGGMKQRLALAIALFGDPPIMLLDEVTASLDTVGRSAFVEMLGRLAGEGRTLLFASHRIDEVAALADRVIELERGRVVADRPTHEFLATRDTDTTLHLQIDPTLFDAAVAHLRRDGFDARRNGTGVLVPVSDDRKARPFRVLHEAQIPVVDFDLVTTPNRTPTRRIGGDA